ncbi:flagellar hook-associated protein FlgK [Actibacterium sp. 188UL27-1]|uniref:flagellar hook-associated protein FlgK n=1 Tax=Actibacterium sp. 188UL27-1 TaxID=2786961 RepID=UPI0019580B22|nr:flagellar hook-associated protein FlgK [Actibacterium sp. 188UL27-1]MBM7069861.1 flagellar hook-associated protein FlgK [Actibacterium sp. 188UL27-1]
MSFTSSMSNALSGLTASARSAEIVSANIANAMTEGYGKREIVLNSRADDRAGNGVFITGVKRIADIGIITDRRGAEAGLARAATISSALSKIEDVTGLPGEAGSLADRFSKFETALIAAASQPQSEPRLAAVVQAADDITTKFSGITDTIQDIRQDADAKIAREVDGLNTALSKVETLNRSISRLSNSGREASALLDQRQQIIDSISEVIPVRQVQREKGTVALFSPTGAILLDGRAAEFGFSKAGLVTPAQSIDNGGLSGLTMNGRSIDVARSDSLIDGGRLSALFETRDRVAPSAQADLDAVARDLIERFQDPVIDPTLAIGDPGLFTDLGATFDPVNELGIAGRLSLNDAVIEDAGGSVVAIRDGLQAVNPTEVGDASQINALIAGFGGDRTPATGPFAGIARKPTELVADFSSTVSTNRQISEGDELYNKSRVDTLKQQELAGGVDTDDELQKLLLVEKAYAANARVISTLDEMLDSLLRI